MKGIGADDDGMVVAGVAVAQTPRGQVEHTDEHGDKHVRLITLARCFVDSLHDTGRIVLMGRSHAEQRVNHCHHHGRWHTLTTDIADAEKQFLVANKIVKDIATHRTGRYQRSTDLYIVTLDLGRLVWQHLHLDIAGNTQFTVDTLPHKVRCL